MKVVTRTGLGRVLLHSSDKYSVSPLPVGGWGLVLAAVARSAYALIVMLPAGILFVFLSRLAAKRDFSPLFWFYSLVPMLVSDPAKLFLYIGLESPLDSSKFAVVFCGNWSWSRFLFYDLEDHFSLRILAQYGVRITRPQRLLLLLAWLGSSIMHKRRSPMIPSVSTPYDDDDSTMRSSYSAKLTSFL